MQRTPGYYWVKGHNEQWEPANFDGKGWWLFGSVATKPLDDHDVGVIGDRLDEPSPIGLDSAGSIPSARPLHITSDLAILDVKRGRKALASAITHAPVPVCIQGVVVRQHGADDGTSIEFEVEVTSVSLKAAEPARQRHKKVS